MVDLKASELIEVFGGTGTAPVCETASGSNVSVTYCTCPAGTTSTVTTKNGSMTVTCTKK